MQNRVKMNSSPIPKDVEVDGFGYQGLDSEENGNFQEGKTKGGESERSRS